MRACEVQSAPSKRHIAPIALVPVPVPCPSPCPGAGAGAGRVLRTLLATTGCELSCKNTFVWRILIINSQKIYLSTYVGQAQFPTCLWFQHTNLMHKISHSSWLKY
ncbi:hypothetical protein HanLR1_Chr05g0171971 [Helianthus annuus]|nr:hypothetical protein HanLR1_Chr05g0171971 [Helianthus annuus]